MPARTRLLDPARPGPATAPTAYNQDGLIVSAPDASVALLVAEALRGTLQHMECGFDGPEWLSETRPTGSTSVPAPTRVFTTGVLLRPLDGRAGTPDPWAILTELRRHPNPAVAGSVGLNHLLTCAEQVGGNPFAIGHGRVGLDSYGVPGFGGRGPVTFVGPPPRPRPGWRPRVVLLDTAIGEHPWFTSEPPVSEFTMRDGSVAGDQIHPYPRDDGVAAAVAAITDPLLGTLGSRAGHGTFIAGLLRQACPDVQIVALPVMGTDGVVPEHMLIRALDLVLAKQLDDPGWADAVVMSLGYYNETPEDVEYSSGLKTLLVKLGRAGVAVFAAAGNDATSRPSYPAAFAADEAFDGPDVLPLLSVAALNPDGTLAAFSNDGPWVTAVAAGVNVVSTVPVTFDGSAQPMLVGQRGGPSAIDLDNFRGGFAAWSGTSFATPILAGHYLNSLTVTPLRESFAGRRELLSGLTKRTKPRVTTQ
jgi:hypothetical protein